jgi:eukaryotic-like serine/threonine-protein kinase
VLAPTETDLPSNGDIIASKYRVEQMLGRGGMGAVFRVTHSVTGKSFAVKWLLQPLGAGPENAQRFIREAQVAGRVDHPNVVEVYDIGEDRGSMYMVMELLQGESLAQHLSQVGRLPPSRACQLLIPVTRGLAAAHKSGIIHRDLKPDNIFLSVSTLGEPRPKILDFGISKMSALTSDVSSALTREGVVMGTPHYMAPEQLRSNKVDQRCDVYALGVILYQMLSGKLPFVGDNFPDLMLKIVSETPVPLAKLASETPVDLITVVERAMARNPEERFESVAELGRALERFGEGALFDAEPTLSTRPPSSIMPVAATPATPVAMESRFPVTAAQPTDFVQRARRFAVPIAVSAASAALLSWVFASTNGTPPEKLTGAAAMRIERPNPATHSTPPEKRTGAAAMRVERPNPATDAKSATAVPAPAKQTPTPEPTRRADELPELAEHETLPTIHLETAPSERPGTMIGGIEAPKAPAIAPFQPPTAAEPAKLLPPLAAGKPQAQPQPSAAKPAPVSSPAPVPPPGADPIKPKTKKPLATKEAPVKDYSAPEMRLHEFY